ncbi:MAG: FliM/FliN family flagellar motor C-terminal domain-containing protein [Steroidobacter sp.]
MNASVRPIHLPGAQALEWIRERARAALDAWARQWLNGWQENDSRISALRVDTNIGESLSDAHQYQPVRSNGGRVWFRDGTSDRTAFGGAVVGSELMLRAGCVDDWIAGVVEHAWQARNDALASELLGAASKSLPVVSELPDELRSFGSGAVHLDCGPLGLHVIVDRSVWRSVPPSQRAARPLPGLDSLEHSLKNARVRLEITLGSVDVDLANVLDLRRGDVLRMRHRLDQPLTLLCAGKPVAKALLGERQGHKCVRIIADHQ